MCKITSIKHWDQLDETQLCADSWTVLKKLYNRILLVSCFVWVWFSYQIYCDCILLRNLSPFVCLSIHHVGQQNISFLFWQIPTLRVNPLPFCVWAAWEILCRCLNSTGIFYWQGRAHLRKHNLVIVTYLLCSSLEFACSACHCT